MTRVCFTLLALLVALPAWAQTLRLDIRDGLVTLSADNVPVRQVLDEWAKVGGTRVVGAERIAGPPLTLSLEGVPEAKALDIILRGAAGYMAAARPAPGVGASIYDRILVLATSTPPAGAAAGAAGGNRPAGANRFGVPPAAEAEPMAEAIPEPQDMPETMPQANPFANAFGQPAGGQFVPPQANPFGQPVPQPGQNPFQPGGAFFQPLQPPQQGVPTALPGFFGSGGSTVPGMIQQPVQPVPQPGQPGSTRPRPQG